MTLPLIYSISLMLSKDLKVENTEKMRPKSEILHFLTILKTAKDHDANFGKTRG